MIRSPNSRRKANLPFPLIRNFIPEYSKVSDVGFELRDVRKLQRKEKPVCSKGKVTKAYEKLAASKVPKKFINPDDENQSEEIDQSEKSPSRENSFENDAESDETGKNTKRPPFLQFGLMNSLRDVQFNPFESEYTIHQCMEVAQRYKDLLEGEPEVLTLETSDKMIDHMVNKIGAKLFSIINESKKLSEKGKETYGKEIYEAVTRKEHENVQLMTGIHLSPQNQKLVDRLAAVIENQHFRREDYVAFVKPHWFDTENTEFYKEFYATLANGVEDLYGEMETEINDDMELPAIAEVELKIEQ